LRIDLGEKLNKAFVPLWKDKSRYLVLWGGAGSGKSVFAAQKLVYRAVTEPGHKFLVVRKVAKTIRQSAFAEVRNVIGSWDLGHLFVANKTDMEISCINGSRFIFAGLDDVEKLKSIMGITSTWVEEASELEMSDFQQIDLRLRGSTNNYKQHVVSFNPVFVTHWLKGYFFDSSKESVRTHHSTYLDNEFIDDEYIGVLVRLRKLTHIIILFMH